MHPVTHALANMKKRLSSLEATVSRLREESKENGAQVQSSLAQMYEHAEAMRRDADGMRRQVARHVAAFDQGAAQMLEDLQDYRSSMAIVVEHLVKKDVEHDQQHENLAQRVDTIERKLAG